MKDKAFSYKNTIKLALAYIQETKSFIKTPYYNRPKDGWENLYELRKEALLTSFEAERQNFSVFYWRMKSLVETLDDVIEKNNINISEKFELSEKEINEINLKIKEERGE